ncbi:MAG: hypothetical protein JJ916_11420 [Phycisphaerales bacterium]|nr:hypothetical protein [Phycisphaerales bacterium]
MKHERKTAKVLVLVAAAVAATVCTLGLSACNTVSGVGKDLQEASDNVKDAIEN